LSEKTVSFSEDFIRLVLEDAARAIQHIHREGWLHLDLTVESVLVAEEGLVKVADFGNSAL